VTEVGPRTCEDCGVEFGGVTARYCPACRTRRQGHRLVYKWTPERDAIMRRDYDPRVRGRSQEIADRLGWPVWVIRHRAALLGLTHSDDRRRWTEEEERFIEENAGSRRVPWMARQLGRSQTSVIVKMTRMRLSRAVREGYTLRDLELCFGADHRAIERWAREGKLAVRKRDYETGAHRSRPWAVSHRAVREFVVNHPMEFELWRVDQLWFMDLVLGGNLLPAEKEASGDLCELAIA